MPSRVLMANHAHLSIPDTRGGRAFSDGEFYFGRVLPGEYELRIAESSLRALRAVAEGAPIFFTVSPAGDQFLVEIPPIRLVPAG